MTHAQINLLVAVTKAVEDLFADDRARRTALQALRGRVEREVEASKLELRGTAGTFNVGDRITGVLGDLVIKGVTTSADLAADDLLPPPDFYDVPPSDLAACYDIYVRGVVRTPGWSEGE